MTPNTTVSASSRFKKNYLHHPTHKVQSEKSNTQQSSEEEEYSLFHLNRVREGPANSPNQVSVIVNGKYLTMELDTGAAVSIISDTTRKSFVSYS